MPISERLGDVHTYDVVSASEIRNRARDFKYAMLAARRETELRYRSLQHGYAISIKDAKLFDIARTQ
jgi:hypothetical protein